MKFGLVCAACAFALALARSAAADDPVVVEYVAPPECASTEAFHALLTAQIARLPSVDRTWRFSVRIVHVDDAYIGRIKTETGTRELHAQTCDAVVSALALVIAMATPLTTPPVTTAPVIAPPPPPPSEDDDDIETLPPLTSPRRVRHARERVGDSSRVIRLALGGQDYSLSSGGFSAAGPAITASIDSRWSWYHMMFELGYGLQFMSVSNGFTTGGQPAAFTITWSMIDFEACPIGVALGDSNTTLYACNSVVIGAATYPSGTESNAGALFFGGEARLRWQSPWKVFLDAHAGAIIGTQSGEWTSGNGWWINVGAQIGIAL